MTKFNFETQRPKTSTKKKKEKKKTSEYQIKITP